MEILLNILIIWLVAELGSGLVHWIEDRYFNPDWINSKNNFVRFIGKNVAYPNYMHHYKPAEMLKGTYWSRNWTTIVPALILAACFWWYWPVCVGFLIMTQANQIHAFAHQKCNKFIRFWQYLGILQSPKVHKFHHTKPYSTDFCVLTNYLNPILNFIHFWRILEYIVLIFSFGTIKPLLSREIY